MTPVALYHVDYSTPRHISLCGDRLTSTSFARPSAIGEANGREETPVYFSGL